jgi:hypothetical protein
MEHFDMESSIVLMRLCKTLTYFFLKNSRDILCLSGNKKPAKELVQFVTRAKDMKTRIPVLCSPGILGLYKGIQINAVIITSIHDSFPKCSLSDVPSMVIHFPQITSTAELFSTHVPFLESLPIDKFGSLNSLMLENTYLTDDFLEPIEDLKVEEMHWNSVSFYNDAYPLPAEPFPSVKRFSGKYTDHFAHRPPNIFPFAEKMVIHCTFESQKDPTDALAYRFDLSESKSLQYL